MNKIIISIFGFLILTSASSYQEKYQFTCSSTNNQETVLKFRLNTQTKTIKLMDTTAFEFGEIKNNTYYGIQTNDLKNFTFSYNWYYETKVKINFKKNIWKLKNFEIVPMSIEFDDNDGVELTKLLYCKLQ